MFFLNMQKTQLRNSIFVDNTASEIIAKEYARYLNNNIGVVTCNKIAAADELNNYLNLKRYPENLEAHTCSKPMWELDYPSLIH